jgi:hypothetical protein
MVVLALSPSQVAAGAVGIEPGKYEVQMRLELPHLEDQAATKTTSVCVTAEPSHGLVVLSDNNPLAKCPIKNIRQTGEVLAFDIICEGENQGVASAIFNLGGDRFSGAITMKMGGKNMTMTERQTGKLTGPCSEHPHS